MSILRLAYVALFLLALIAVFVLWSEVGGQNHLDLLPWFWKLALGAGAAYAATRATAAAVAEKDAWNRHTRRWCVALAFLLLACGLLTYYAHVYLESDEDQQDSGEPGVALLVGRTSGLPWC